LNCNAGEVWNSVDNTCADPNAPVPVVPPPVIVPVTPPSNNVPVTSSSGSSNVPVIASGSGS
jgi:hypothetical protein